MIRYFWPLVKDYAIKPKKFDANNIFDIFDNVDRFLIWHFRIFAEFCSLLAVKRLNGHLSGGRVANFEKSNRLHPRYDVVLLDNAKGLAESPLDDGICGYTRTHPEDLVVAGNVASDPDARIFDAIPATGVLDWDRGCDKEEMAATGS